MTVAGPSPTQSPSLTEDEEFLNSVEGEITFFRSIMRARPVGIHRYFHVLAIRKAIHKDTNRLVEVEAIWNKLKSCYNLDALEAAFPVALFQQDSEHENLYTPHKNSLPISIPSPSPSDNLGNHPFFRAEYQLPDDDYIESIVAQRRMRATASAPSTPAASPQASLLPLSSSTSKRSKGTKKNGKSQSKMAGLVGGDSDSSALTQESGDETLPETPRESMVGTEAGTDSGDDEDTEMRGPSPRSVSPKPTRGRQSKGTSKRGRGAAARGGGSTSTRSTKKRKR
ncbi:hypothetical protein H1R20_g7343, partial [Candolleomyces eurysporus]